MPEPSPAARAVAAAIIAGAEAIAADLREMAAGEYTGRHCQAWLDGGAVAGSATPSPNRPCGEFVPRQDWPPLADCARCGYPRESHADPQPLCGTCGQPLENGKCFRYHPEALAGPATPTPECCGCVCSVHADCRGEHEDCNGDIGYEAAAGSAAPTGDDDG